MNDLVSVVYVINGVEYSALECTVETVYNSN